MEMRQQLINHNRPGARITPTSVTMHNTGNPNSTAQNNRDYFSNHPNAKVSSHWVVDDKEAIQCIPESEMSWHAGPEANRQSISIEVCEFTDPARHEKAYRNAVELAADILRRYKWGTDRLTTHKRWTGKECPRHILPIWDKFIADVQAVLTPPKDNIVLTAINFEGKKYPANIKGDITYLTLRTLVDMLGQHAEIPLRAFADNMGMHAQWSAATRETTLRRKV